MSLKTALLCFRCGRAEEAEWSDEEIAEFPNGQPPTGNICSTCCKALGEKYGFDASSETGDPVDVFAAYLHEAYKQRS